MDWEISNHNFIKCRKVLVFFFFFSVSVISLYALFSTINAKTASLGVTSSAETKSDCYHFQERQLHGEDNVEDEILLVNDNEDEFEEEKDEMIIATKSIVIRRILLITSAARTRLSDGSLVRSKGFMMSVPGSSPPRCTSKCGKCRPCKPVHVPVPPGTPVTTEYYPEAWRCKCGNKLYMP